VVVAGVLLLIGIMILAPFVHNLAAFMCANGAWFLAVTQTVSLRGASYHLPGV
jgi:hypothetical protein